MEEKFFEFGRTALLSRSSPISVSSPLILSSVSFLISRSNPQSYEEEGERILAIRIFARLFKIKLSLQTGKRDAAAISEPLLSCWCRLTARDLRKSRPKAEVTENSGWMYRPRFQNAIELAHQCEESGEFLHFLPEKKKNVRGHLPMLGWGKSVDFHASFLPVSKWAREIFRKAVFFLSPNVVEYHYAFSRPDPGGQKIIMPQPGSIPRVLEDPFSLSSIFPSGAKNDR